jgi:hypothetical protein
MKRDREVDDQQVDIGEPKRARNALSERNANLPLLHLPALNLEHEAVVERPKLNKADAGAEELRKKVLVKAAYQVVSAFALG